MGENIFFANSQNTLKNFRIWCSYKKIKNIKFNNISMSWAIIFCACCIAILSFLDVFEAFQTDQVDVKFEKLLFLCVILVIIQKICTVTYTEKNILACINQLQNVSLKFENKTNFDNAHRMYKKMFDIGIWAMNVSVFFFMIAPAIFLQKRKLFFQPKIPFLNIQESPIWELMFMFQSINAFVITNITLAYDTLYCGMLGISTAALKSVSREIQEIDEVIRNHGTSAEKLINIIEKIIEISDITNKISDVFAITTMLHIVYTCGTMALGMYVMSFLPFNDLNCFSMVLGTIMSAFLLWIYCYFGQNLVDQRRKLQTELYFLKWYDASKKVKILILVSSSVLQRDSFVYAGKIIPLSMETFGQVLLKAYTYYTFMKDMKHN